MKNEKKLPDAFTAGIVELLPRLWRFALTLSRQRVLAEDLVQQTCERALERRDQYLAGSRQDQWLFAIMSSIWKNHIRSEKVRRGLGQIDSSELWDDGQIASIETNLLKSQMVAAVLELPAWQREPVILVYVEDFSYREAAEILDLPVGTIMSRLASAKIALAEKLNPDAPARRRDLSVHG